MRNVAVIGMGHVGATVAFNLFMGLLIIYTY